MNKFKLPAGTTNRHQWHKPAAKAVENLTRTFNMIRQLHGIIGATEGFHKESESLVSVLGFGVDGPTNVAAVEIFERLGDKFGWEITRDNAERIAQAFIRALPDAMAGIVVEDNRRTPEADAELTETRNKQHAEYERKATIKADQVDVLADKLRKQFPHAIGSDQYKTGSARAAANLKKELQAKFPRVKFSVTSDTFSMGDSVDVSYTDGPALETVESIANGYQCGTFDPMIDLSGYDNSTAGRAVDLVLGRAKFVHTNRKYSPQVEEQAQRAVCEAYGVEFDGPETVFDPTSGDYHSRKCSNRAWRILQGQDIAGDIESLDIEPGTFGEFVFKTVEPQPVAASTAGYVIEEYTHTKHGFQMWLVIPAERVERDVFCRLRDAAKAAGGWYSRKWSTTPGGFAFKAVEDAETFAAAHFGDGGENPDPERPSTPSSPYGQGLGMAEKSVIPDKLRDLANNKAEARLTRSESQ